jgi:hypothetical protein
VFLNIIINGCLFHFAQSVYRRIQTLPELYALFFADVDGVNGIRHKIKSIFSLAFVAPDFVYEHFCLLVYSFPDMEDVQSKIKIF